ncbi:MAG: hypothetical protein BWY08_00757 [Bacteroidetes bacterium ADurb.Bin174]|jgi:hypothetical protein|nr:MAG: hypothetical protein BWY08_00757 [Bacteroidetes bacterium ADurb.Bin174]HNT90474.1 hypothetical protein [Smithellaceae bacterium]HPY34620.1 hypothetical protein [Smithellaceae bacterium]HQB91867.1 hypothetical protein [Smithellaceae bacterium]
MELYTIEVDEKIFNYLKQKAEPFVDTPNTVLHRLLFGKGSIYGNSKIFVHRTNQNIPKALSQILEVIELVIQKGHSRPEATKIVAERNGTAPETVIDKYCRQLGKTANEVDILLSDPELKGFQLVLTNKFTNHEEMITSFFNSLVKEEGKMNPIIPRREFDQLYSLGEIKRDDLSSDRKKRDTALESVLKKSLGKRLQEQLGHFTLRGQSQLMFNNAIFLCKYSSFHDDQSRWFWGVSKSYWHNWKQTDHLVLILENADKNGYSYIILTPDESKHLFSVCSDSRGEKKINMRIYADDNVTRLPEWKDFDVESRLKPLELQSCLDNPTMDLAPQEDKSDPVQVYLRLFASASPEEQKRMLKELMERVADGTQAK